MKRIWMGRKGVSPVIATILMVAITVVLAAVLYVMVSGYMGGSGMSPVSGALSYLPNLSNPNGGNATFELSISNPANPLMSEASVKILDPNGNLTTNITYNWNHLSSDATHLKGGDRMTITAPAGVSLLRYEVIVTLNGYNGVISGKVPA